eukprot:CAMPEP_0174754310 /NCGR_PEP_ID=MMETSP1094-20130205/105672_1 /TAXON_ID=156173 /ORGANISM="Chrysochromulina brevifilum, Strain UTEX LB 985" /LENGTH=117 /DNA_ID=CAMNT_0015960173 /DNA_START=485 /DNA_END=839 /DNA_ORIENTATION=+
MALRVHVARILDAIGPASCGAITQKVYRAIHVLARTVAVANPERIGKAVQRAWPQSGQRAWARRRAVSQAFVKEALCGASRGHSWTCQSKGGIERVASGSAGAGAAPMEAAIKRQRC